MEPIAFQPRRAARQACRIVVVSLVAVWLSACGGGGSSEALAPIHETQSGPPATTSQSSSPLPFAWPALGGPARVFNYSSALLLPVGDYTRTSRLVLYDSGSFEAQFGHVQSGQISTFSGRYRQTQGVITFDWDVRSKYPWGATGALDGTSLTLRYNDNMHLDDFEDAVYVLTP